MQEKLEDPDTLLAEKKVKVIFDSSLLQIAYYQPQITF
jgi:hypothetical protein